ncbi:MAG: VCBS repeat-containing protein [Acidobacteria bacterium]|nr:VCBS repeat-containing protein [Acidobacteriota bacterium]
MSTRSPQRSRQCIRVHSSLLATALLAATLGSTPAGAAKQKLPGQIPNAPKLVEGYPIPFPQTTTFRSEQGGLLATDLDGDGEHELVLSISTGLVAVLNLDGSYRPGWPRTFEDLPQPAYPFGPPAVGDLDGDGRAEIVTCVVAGVTPRRSYLYAFRIDGEVQAGWPIEIQLTGPQLQTCSAAGVLMADLDGDDLMEVVVAVNLGRVVAFDGNGHLLPGWPVLPGPDPHGNLRGINAAFSASDLDADGAAEVIFIESGLEPRLLAVSWDGRIRDGFPVLFGEIVDRQAPAVADLDGDGIPELIQATLPVTGDLLEEVAATREPTGDEMLIPPALHVLRADGTNAPGWPRLLSQGGSWGPLLVDLTGDGRPEILQQDGEDLYAFNAEGEVLPGFPYTLRRDFNQSQSIDSTPWLAADLNHDGSTDLLTVRSNIYLGNSYMRIFGLRDTGQPLKGFPFEVENHRAASLPVVLDVSGDGIADLVMLTIERLNGRRKLMAWDLGSLLPTSRR